MIFIYDLLALGHPAGNWLLRIVQLQLVQLESVEGRPERWCRLRGQGLELKDWHIDGVAPSTIILTVTLFTMLSR